jgi:O-antigen ligase
VGGIGGQGCVLRFRYGKEVFMRQKSNQLALDLTLVFGLFFLSNATAFLYVVWIVPEIVFMELVVLALFAAFSVWILKRFNLVSDFWKSLKRNWFILPFLAFSALSIFWSVYWQVSLYRWLILVLTVSTGGYIGVRYEVRQIIRFLSVFGVYILFISVIVIVFLPTNGIMNYYNIQGAWRGIYWHKNHMGMIASFVYILVLINLIYSLPSKRKAALTWGILYLFSLVFLFQTDSAGAYFTTIFLYGVVFLSLFFLKFKHNLRLPHYLIMIAFMSVAALVLYLNLDFFFGIFNRNTSLTGRIPMWSHLFEMYFDTRPIFGYGFNAFWYIEPYRVEMALTIGYPDQIVIADNGFIDILINTGYMGLALFALFYLAAWWRSVKYAITATDIIGFFPLILMSYTLIANVSWSLIFENESFFMLVMISLLFAISSTAATGKAERVVN